MSAVIAVSLIMASVAIAAIGVLIFALFAAVIAMGGDAE